MNAPRSVLEGMPLEDLLRLARTVGVSERVIEAVRKGAKTVRELIDLIVREVSLVDRGANGRVFLVRKSAASPQEETVSARLHKNPDGSFSPEAPVVAKAARPISAIFEALSAHLVAKALTVNPMVRRIAFQKAMQAEDCLNRAMNTVMYADDSGMGPGDLEPLLADEFDMASQLLAAVAAACRGQEYVQRAADPAPVEKAGRAISKANMERLRTLRKSIAGGLEALGDATSQFDGFLTELEGAKDGDDVEKAAPSAAAPASDPGQAAPRPAAEPPRDTAFAADADPHAVFKAELGEIKAGMAQMTKMMALLEGLGDVSKGAVPAPSRIPDDDDDIPPPVNDGTTWPQRFNFSDAQT